MRKEEGITLTGFIFVAVIVIFALLLGFKIGPAYFEYWSIQKQLKAIANDVGRSGNRREIEAAWVSRAQIENIQSISHNDLQITKDGNDVVLSAEYAVKVPLFGNLSACMDFNPSSASR